MEKTVEEHQKIVDAKIAEMDKSVEKSETVKKEEARGASSDSSTGKEKTKENAEPTAEQKAKEAASKAEAQAKEDEEILGKEEKDLSEDQLKRKTILAEKKKKPEEQSNLDKRFGELTGEIKDLKSQLETENDRKNQDNGKISVLEAKIAELENKLNPPKDTIESQIKKAELERITKYAEEDKNKPNAERREMTKDDLDTWFMEDPVEAQEWMIDRSYRRNEEKKEQKAELQKKEIDKKALESYERILKLDPEVDIRKVEERGAALKVEGAPIKEIHAKIRKEFPKIILMQEIAREHPEWEKKPNGPELVFAELQKRLKKPKEEKKDDKAEVEQKAKEEKIRTEAAEAERQRQANIDEGNNSNTDGSGLNENSEAYQKQLKIMVKSGGTKEELDNILKRRQTIPGAAIGR